MHKDIEFTATVMSFYDLMRKIYAVTYFVFIIGIPPVFINNSPNYCTYINVQTLEILQVIDSNW